MREGPDIAGIGALVGDPARANMLTALMAGQALTAAELARIGGVTPQTASAHLARLAEGGLVTLRKQGRHRYFALSGPDVSALLELMMGVAANRGHLRHRPGPKDPALRRARICYDHLAGDLGVRVFESLAPQGHLDVIGQAVALTPAGRARMAELGIDLPALATGRRPLCRSCLDWSARRNHLAGALGAELLRRFDACGWARREPGTRVIRFSSPGEAALQKAFPLPLA